MLTTIFLMTILILSVTLIGTTLYSRIGNAITAEVCKSFQMLCGQTTTAAPSSSKKFFQAIFLQYVGNDIQVEVYKPNMDIEDQTQLRVEGDDGLSPAYIKDALSLPGSAGVTFKSSEAIIENAARVKNLGFEFIDFNLESGLSPSSDTNDVVEAMLKAAQAAHEEGLKFRASPSIEYTTQYGAQIGSFADYYLIQAQSLQGDGVKAYSDYVHGITSKLKIANPDLVINVQVSTQQDNASRLSLLETLKRCTNAVMDVADGMSIWYGSSDLNRLKSYVEWYNATY